MGPLIGRRKKFHFAPILEKPQNKKFTSLGGQLKYTPIDQRKITIKMNNKYITRSYKSLLGAKPINMAKVRARMAKQAKFKKFKAGLRLPSHFNAAEKWKRCVRPISLQACDNCWAHATIDNLSDAICAKYGTNVQLSYDYVTCMRGGCIGGEFWDWVFLLAINKGIVDSICYELHTFIPKTCHKMCDGYYRKLSVADAPRFYLHSFREMTDINEVKQWMMDYGSAITSFTVTDDFFDYPKAGWVYERATGTVVDDHMVRVVGWEGHGTNTVWIAANSWSPSWGDQGYFRIRHGTSGFGTVFAGSYPKEPKSRPLANIGDFLGPKQTMPPVETAPVGFIKKGLGEPCSRNWECQGYCSSGRCDYLR